MRARKRLWWDEPADVRGLGDIKEESGWWFAGEKGRHWDLCRPIPPKEPWTQMACLAGQAWAGQAWCAPQCLTCSWGSAVLTAPRGHESHLSQSWHLARTQRAAVESGMGIKRRKRAYLICASSASGFAWFVPQSHIVRGTLPVALSLPAAGLLPLTVVAGERWLGLGRVPDRLSALTALFLVDNHHECTSGKAGGPSRTRSRAPRASAGPRFGRVPWRQCCSTAGEAFSSGHPPSRCPDGFSCRLT